MSDSAQLFQQAKQYIAGGVNSPVRSFNGVDGHPLFIASASGAYIYDSDHKAYIDYVGSWGPMIVGHAHAQVIEAVKHAAEKGLSFGCPTEIETHMAKMICQLMPSIEKVRMVSSGTEATMSAIRLAKGYTQRQKIVKFEGCYHGHSDALLVKAGSGALTFGVPSSAGVSPAVAADTLTLAYNDGEAVRELFAELGEQIACVIVEPVAGNMNCVPPVDGFLQTLRTLCSDNGAVLIFDEVMTGFRVGLQGAQGHYGVMPDLTTLGKVIGGGLPVGAFGGRADIMDCLAPTGAVYQAGTLSGNPVAMAAGLKTLELIQAPDFFAQLTQKTYRLTQGLKRAAEQCGVAMTTQSVGGMFGLFFTDIPVVSRFEQVMACDVAFFKRFFHAMLEKGVYLAPSAFEAGFVSSAHSNALLDETVEHAQHALNLLAKNQI